MLFMISQPMGGLSEEEILSKRNQVKAMLEQDGHSVIDTFYTTELPKSVKNSGLFWLGASLMDMAKCDAVYFCSGWENARGCKIEHDAAISYGMLVLYEE